MIKGAVPSFAEAPRVSLREHFLSREIPHFYPDQVAAYSREALLENPVGQFNPQEVQSHLLRHRGAKALVGDIGGDKVKIGEAIVGDDGAIHIARTEVVVKSKDNELGYSYLEPLVRLGQAAAELGLPVGISTAGVVRNDHLDGTYNISHLVERIDGQYGGDMKRFIPTLTSLENDAPPPLKATLMEVVRENPVVTHAVEVIVGGGLGGTVFLGTGNGNGTIFALEPGHIPAVGALREIEPGYIVEQRCELGGVPHDYTCVENVAGGKAMGRILQSLLKKDHQIGGHEMIDIVENGSDKERKTILTVLDNAANVVAHVVEGIDKAYNGQLLASPETTLLAWHGGIFEIPGFRERVEQILSKRLQEKLGREVSLTTLKTSDVSKDVALVGAAIGALSVE